MQPEPDIPQSAQLQSLETSQASVRFRDLADITLVSALGANRLPAILERDQVATWLHGNWSDAAHMATPYSGKLDVRQVSNDVGNVRNNHAELISPLDI